MNDYTYFIYESTETSAEISTIAATELEDAIAETRLLWSNYTARDKSKINSFTLYRVPADTVADVDNDACEEICELAYEM